MPYDVHGCAQNERALLTSSFQHRNVLCTLRTFLSKPSEAMLAVLDPPSRAKMQRMEHGATSPKLIKSQFYLMEYFPQTLKQALEERCGDIMLFSGPQGSSIHGLGVTLFSGKEFILVCLYLPFRSVDKKKGAAAPPPFDWVITVISDVGEGLLFAERARILHLVGLLLQLIYGVHVGVYVLHWFGKPTPTSVRLPVPPVQDVSLHNVMVTALVGHPKLPHAVLVDFGCARKVPRADLRWAMKCDPLRMGNVFGNQGHIAPELHAAWDQLRASDVVFNFSRQVRPRQRVRTHASQA